MCMANLFTKGIVQNASLKGQDRCQLTIKDHADVPIQQHLQKLVKVIRDFARQEHSYRSCQTGVCYLSVRE